MRKTPIKTKGRRSNYLFGDFAVLRVNGSLLGGQNPPRYCYEFRFKGEVMKRFRYQYEALSHVGDIMRHYREIISRRQKEETDFIRKHDLPSFPEEIS